MFSQIPENPRFRLHIRGLSDHKQGPPAEDASRVEHRRGPQASVQARVSFTATYHQSVSVFDHRLFGEIPTSERRDADSQK